MIVWVHAVRFFVSMTCFFEAIALRDCITRTHNFEFTQGVRAQFFIHERYVSLHDARAQF